jgi:hypothetical protein
VTQRPVGTDMANNPPQSLSPDQGAPVRPAIKRRPAAIDRFTLTFLRGELRGRLRQALLIALGLGLGVGLVITVTASSAGISNAQRTVLHSLYGIGNDLTITNVNSPATGS